MASSSLTLADDGQAARQGEAAPAAALIGQLGALLDELEPIRGAASIPRPSVIAPEIDNRLAQVRLGVAGSLYTALACKHAGAASHCLRVALGVSAWATKLGLDGAQRDAIEVAALLHDVGLIGVPDQILLKPAPLDADEAMVFGWARKMSLEILRGACAEPAILEIVENVGAWFDGSKVGYVAVGEQIPFGARMIHIVEAFDAMTTDQVYRRAMSEERAMRELFAFAGAQFDPELVRRFADLRASDSVQLRCEAAARWLQSLDPHAVNAHWEFRSPTPPSGAEADALFPARLLDNMHDAVVFVDSAMRIFYWNHGAERLTGISAASVRQRPWTTELLHMRNEKGEPLGDDDCPARSTVQSGVQSLRRLTILGRAGRPVAVDSHVIPVASAEGATLGAVLLLHDASSEISLELRCQNLHDKATRDPLTQVANRAEFDRVHQTFVNTHRQQQIPCSLIICDLDHFKQINDTYGHQAGDEVIRSLATLMKNSCRPGDLVARYGGEEFVILCADCDNAAAVRRAETVRKAFAQLLQPKLGGRSVTASFGVTEIQPGDTAETMLRRADRALLQAKESGRNRVVQLGVGSGREPADEPAASPARQPPSSASVIRQALTTPVPLAMALEKFRGFVADHRAKIVKIEGNEVELEIADDRPDRKRRFGDRPVVFRLDLRFEEERFERARGAGPGLSAALRTRMHVTIAPRRNRDRRRADILQRAAEVLVSFRSYLMASGEEETPDAPPDGFLRRVQRALAPWLANRRS